MPRTSSGGRLSLTIAALVLMSGQALAAGPPIRLTLAPASAEIPIGETRPFTVTLLDADDQVAAIEANSQVGFAVDSPSIASITPSATNPLVGDVLGKQVGTTPVRAFYLRGGVQTNIFADSDVTVVAAAGGPSSVDGSADADVDASGGGDGCGCRVTPTTPAAILGALVLLGLLVRRRRRND